MPGRKVPLVNDEIYHVFNRGIDRRLTFIYKKDYKRAIATLHYYKVSKPGISLSHFLQLSKEKQELRGKTFSSIQQNVELLAFCLMPNHFHLLLKQKIDNGIAQFLSNFQNSYTKYFNLSHSRDGSLFLDQFKAVRVETDEQLLHVSRYIHLNPFSSYIVKTIDDLYRYEWSSLSKYFNLNNNLEFVDTEQILNYFQKPLEYQKFIKDHANYQRYLKSIQHLLLE